eukprot:a180082_88.p1 GENE.a180082_88~~a180082_88.p1  ORF type:complete len:274 (+),score=96.82 a180082_88:27-824(+)
MAASTSVVVGGVEFALTSATLERSKRLVRDSACGALLVYDRDAEIFAHVLSILRYGSIQAVLGDARMVRLAFSCVSGLSAGAQDAEPSDEKSREGANEAFVARVAFRLVADLEFFEVDAEGVAPLVAAWRSRSAPDVLQALALLREQFSMEDPDVAVNRAVHYWVIGGTAEFSVVDTALRRRRVIHLSRTKIRIQEPAGRSVVKSVYGKAVKLTLSETNPRAFELALAHGMTFNFEAPDEKACLVTAYTIRGFNDKYQTYVRLDS